MNTKEIEPVTVVYKEVKTNLQNIAQYVGNEPAKLMQQAMEENLEITAPQIWEYIDTDGNPEKEFTLRIGIPVKKTEDCKLQNIKILPTFKCAVMEHKGSWDKLKFSYEKLINEIVSNSNKLSNYSREIYHNCDFENEENNITEIQIGIE